MRWIFSDGTVFYLAKSASAADSQARAALGSKVWRRKDGKDGLFEDNIGPSGYAKAQGEAVRVWGFLIAGKFYIDLVPSGEIVDQAYYAELLEEKLDKWKGHCDLLAQDYERCLRAPESLAAMRSIGVELVKQYPRCSQDLNPVENCWNLLRQRLAESQPTCLEPRDKFESRVVSAVHWMNTKHSDALRDLWMSQKKRGRELLEAEPPGSRLGW
jgi:hypothetical protein